MKASIALLPGDGIGPEVIFAARDVLAALAARTGHDLRFETYDIGGIALERWGDPLPEATFTGAFNADAVLMGAVGGPEWSDPRAKRRPEQGLLALRSGLQVYASLRPVKVWSSLADVSPLRSERVKDVDFLIVRELTGGSYFGAPKFRESLQEGGHRAVDTLEYTDREVRRVAKLAFELATERRAKVTSVDKANVLETSRLWRQVVAEVSVTYPGVVLEHRLIDSTAMQLIMRANTFDVLVTENMFGDFLTGEAAVICGSIGLLPSAALSDHGPKLFEPVHGAASDIAGQGIANPIGAIRSAAMLCHYGLQLPEEAALIEQACEAAVAAGARTPDLGGTARTSDVTRAVIDAL